MWVGGIMYLYYAYDMYADVIWYAAFLEVVTVLDTLALGVYVAPPKTGRGLKLRDIQISKSCPR